MDLGGFFLLLGDLSHFFRPICLELSHLVIEDLRDLYYFLSVKIGTHGDCLDSQLSFGRKSAVLLKLPLRTCVIGDSLKDECREIQF